MSTGRLAISQINRYLPVVASIILVCLMMVCVTTTVVNVIQRIIPRFSGVSFYLVAVFISLEAMLSWQIAARSTILNSRTGFQRLAEFVAILIFVKLATYAGRGFDELTLEVSRWQDDFLGSFFNPQYLFTIIFTFFIWLLAGMMGQWLGELEHDPDQLDLEREGYAIRDRESVRKSLIGLVFSVGGVILVVTAFLRLDIQSSRFVIQDQTYSGWNLPLYFVLGLSLLALTRFSALRSRWYIQKIPVRENLAVRWFVYALVFLLILGGIAILLPTRYSVGLLSLIGGFISIIASIVGFLELLILAPIMYLLKLLSTLFSGEAIDETPMETPEPIFTPPPPGAAPLPWLEVLKSIIFWGVFLGIVGFSLYHYLAQRTGLIAAVRQVPFFRWLSGIFRSLFGFFQRVRVEAAREIRSRVRRFRLSRKAGSGSKTRRPWLPGSPREEVLSAYLTLIEENDLSELKRKMSQTPNEYANFLDDQVPEVRLDIDGLTDAFIQARYSEHEIGPDLSSRVRDLLRRIERAIQEKWESRREE